MFTFLKPSDQQLESFLSSQIDLQPNLDQVGLTRNGGAPPSGGYNRDEAKQVLGTGEEMFECLVKLLKEWKHFDIWWLLVYPDQPEMKEGTTLVVVANHGPLWSLNACKIVYVIDEEDATHKRFGYGYATLQGHSEQGEERFLLQLEKSDNKITYEIYAFSRSNHPLVSLMYPVARAFQNTFRSDSIKTLQRHLVKAMG